MARERKDSLLSDSDLSFHFQGLDRETNEIRLFRLQPGRFDDPICGSLQTCQINDCPPFRALSYEWLKDTPRHKVYLDSGVIKIRLNLFMFLRSYRGNTDPEDPVEYLWIDHICIDQEDVLERNHQVQLMSWIFSNADEVVAWLGPDYDQYKYFKHHPPGGSDCPMVCRCVSIFGEKRFCSSFWDRLWIQQEMVLASKVTFMIGKRAVPASQALKCFKGNPWLVSVEPALRAALKDDSNELRTFTLLKAIRLFSRKVCNDPRDKVYGLLGMVWPHQRIPVDYKLKTHQVFHQTVDAVFTQEDFPTANFRENYVVSTLVKLGNYMGINHDDAFGVCQHVANTRVPGGYYFHEYLQRRWSAPTPCSSRSTSPSRLDWTRVASRNASSSSFEQ